MRAAAAFSIEVPAQRAWRLGVGVLGFVAAAAFLVWWVAPAQQLRSELRYGLGMGALLAWVLAMGAVRLRPISLRWDGAQWWMGATGCGVERMEVGSVRVMMDLSGFLLLRFDRTASPWRPRSSWIPLQRGGLDGVWHALRCAVYSARSGMGTTIPGDSPLTASPGRSLHE